MKTCIRAGKLARIIFQDNNAWFVPAHPERARLTDSISVSGASSPSSVKATGLFHRCATGISSGPMFGLENLVTGVCFTIFLLFMLPACPFSLTGSGEPFVFLFFVYRVQLLPRLIGHPLCSPLHSCRIGPMREEGQETAMPGDPSLPCIHLVSCSPLF